MNFLPHSPVSDRNMFLFKVIFINSYNGLNMNILPYSPVSDRNMFLFKVTVFIDGL